MTVYWRYLIAGKAKRKHAFKNMFHPTSFCGYSVPWYIEALWKEDAEGLNEREECKRCNMIMALPPGVGILRQPVATPPIGALDHHPTRGPQPPA
jgi:hypothetical protein